MHSFTLKKRQEMDLNGKVVIITGAARGIGRAFAKALLEKGAKVCLSDINDKLGSSTREKLSAEYGMDKVIFVKCDVTNKDDFQNVFEKTKEKMQGIDIVINNAGLVNEDDWETCVHVNLMGVIRGTILAADILRTDKGGRGGTVVNMSSIAAYGPNQLFPVYTATKHGVNALTKSFAEIPKLKENGVRFVCICPSGVDTDLMTAEIRKQVADTFGFTDFMSTDDIVKGLFKVLDDADNNGGALVIDGNEHENLFVYK